jgi:hypothetical protein
MQAVKSDHPVTKSGSTFKLISVAIILVILLVMVITINNAYQPLQPASLLQSMVTISQSVLEEKYGLRVNLLAVTAAGGMVDLRLKMLDGEKARLLLQDKQNFPALYVNDNRVTLNASEDDKSQEIKFENNGGLYLLFPNNGNAVKPGSTVIIEFGDVQLEPIVSK